MSPNHVNESDTSPLSPGEGGDQRSLADATHLCLSQISLRCSSPCSLPPSALHAAELSPGEPVPPKNKACGSWSLQREGSQAGRLETLVSSQHGQGLAV